jgi:NAD(P)-dependent dehydrogenase (short-subunit alcohol dehydrogenase family)
MVKDGSNIVVILQARIGSTRLPRKVMNEILGKPVLIHDLERIKEMETINKIVVATTNLEKDDIIVKTVRGYDRDIGIYRGSESDVLVNIAAKSTSNTFENLMAKEWDEVIATNLRGTFLMCREGVNSGLLKNGNIPSGIGYGSIYI